MPNLHQTDLVSSLSDLFTSSKYSDLTIRCGSDLYKVHRAVVCQRSTFFAAACDSGFREAITATITLDGDDQATVRRMLTYLYTLDYDDQDASKAVAMIESQNTDGHVADSIPNSEMIDDATMCKRMNNVLVYALAEKYNICALKDLAKAKFVGCEGSRSFTVSPELINAIFESTPDTDSGLRNTVICTCADSLNLEKELEEEEGLAQAIRDHGSLGLGILRKVVKELNAKLENLYAELEMKKQDAEARENDLGVALEGSNAKIQNLNAQHETKDQFAKARKFKFEMALESSKLMTQSLNAELEMKKQNAEARENDLGVALEGLNAKIQNLNAEQETKERDAVARVIELKVTLGWLYHDAMNFYIPKKNDSSGAFERFRRDLDLFREKLLNLKDSVKA